VAVGGACRTDARGVDGAVPGRARQGERGGSEALDHGAPGDTVTARIGDRERVLEVVRAIDKRVGAPSPPGASSTTARRRRLARSCPACWSATLRPDVPRKGTAARSTGYADAEPGAGICGASRQAGQRVRAGLAPRQDVAVTESTFITRLTVRGALRVPEITIYFW